MDNVKAVYKILSALEKAMDFPEFDIEQISAAKLGVSQERWSRYIEMMADVGYIKGVRVYEDLTGEMTVEDEGIRITLKGLEYLQENPTMKRIYRTLKGVKEIVPSELNELNR